MKPGADHADLVQSSLGGDRRSLAKLLTLLTEDTDPGLISEIELRRRGAQVVGVTGPPGVGKSSLVDRVVTYLRAGGGRPGVVAVDPSSPFTGGAILGDRVRMQHHSSDDDVFIRSMANRGRLGGLAAGTGAVVAALDAAGFDPILVETVGVGQSELEVIGVTPTVVVVLPPGFGDEIQVAKAGLLEIAHVLCVNKSDLGEADAAAARLLADLPSGHGDGWTPPVIVTSARTGEGIDALWDAVTAHRSYLRQAVDDEAPASSA